ncbi:MAG: aldose 1-epimerase family protein [Clostridia bacterium]|nr:aldose 1-epimerase family protein [Clostridia bacterium]
MAEQLILSNDCIKATLSTKGAELISVIKNGEEKIWQGDPSFWAGQAPLLFPICGGLKDDKFVFENQEYTLQKHGYARFCEFEVEDSGENRVVFLLHSDEESRKQFPFDYELRVIYTLEGSNLLVSYQVTNLTDKEMYFSIGAHEGYSCPEGIEEYSVIFEQEENLDSNILNGNLLEYETINVGKNTRELPLRYEYFAVDALVFLGLKSRKVTLKHRATGKCVGLDFSDAEYFLLWTKPGAKYICLEPWWGIQDFVDSNYDLTQKRGIVRLAPHATTTKEHTILF